MSKNYKVWTCKIVISADSELPSGFDFPPRMAAEQAIESEGFTVLMNSSGWGGELDEYDLRHLEQVERTGKQEVYYAGVMDTPEDVEN